MERQLRIEHEIQEAVPMQNAWTREVDRLRSENERLREELRQVAIDFEHAELRMDYRLARARHIRAVLEGRE